MATRAERSAERRRFWLQHFEQRCASGQSVRAYASQHELSVQSWYAARKRYVGNEASTARRVVANVEKDTAPRFARVATAPMPLHPTMACRIHLGNGVLVELDVAAQALPSVLAAAGGVR